MRVISHPICLFNGKKCVGMFLKNWTSLWWLECLSIYKYIIIHSGQKERPLLLGSTVIKYHCNTEDLSLYMIIIFLFIHSWLHQCMRHILLLYSHLYRLLSMWPLECCMDEEKAVNWGLANQSFTYKTSIKVLGRKEPLWKIKTKHTNQATTKTCSVEQYSKKKKLNRFSWKSLHIETIMTVSKEKYIPSTVISNSISY